MRFQFVQGDESLTGHSGLALVGAILERTALRERCQKIELSGHPFLPVPEGSATVT